MARIEDMTPVLKTLFTIKTPKPNTELWNTQYGAQVAEKMAVKILLHDAEMVEQFIKDCPEYVVQIYEKPTWGFVTFEDAEEKDVFQNPKFSGASITLELHPGFSLRNMLLDLYARLTSIADQYIIDRGIEVNFDEPYCWMGASFESVKSSVTKGIR